MLYLRNAVPREEISGARGNGNRPNPVEHAELVSVPLEDGIRMRRASLLRAVLVLLLSSQVPSAWSWTCDIGSACSYLVETSVIFVGKVVDPGHFDNEEMIRPARLEVEEALVGLASTTEEVELFGVDWLELGQRMLLYANRSENGKLYVGGCNASGKVEAREEHLAYLRRVAKGYSKASIAGRVGNGYGAPPIAEAVVIAISDEGEHRTSTDSEGLFELEDLPPDEYRLSVQKDGFTLRRESDSMPGRITLVAGACGVQQFEIHRDGLIEGMLIGPNGSPAVDVRVELVSTGPEDGDGMTVRTDDAGKYQLLGVEPGRYLVGVNIVSFDRDSPYYSTYYPGVSSEGEAAIISLGPSEKVSLPDLWLPPALEDRTIVVEVTWPDGSPVSQAQVYVTAMDDESDTDLRFRAGDTGEDGRLAVRGIHKMSLALRASVTLRQYKGRKRLIWSSEEAVLKPDEQPATVRLVLSDWATERRLSESRSRRTRKSKQ